MASLADIVFDCAHPSSLARFWAAALDDYAVAPYDNAELARLASIGITDIEDDSTVLVEPDNGGPRLWFQQVPEPKANKNRVHLDIRATDRQREVKRLQALGATVLDDDVDGLTVMRDPEGTSSASSTRGPRIPASRPEHSGSPAPRAPPSLGVRSTPGLSLITVGRSRWSRFRSLGPPDHAGSAWHCYVILGVRYRAAAEVARQSEVVMQLAES